MKCLKFIQLYSFMTLISFSAYAQCPWGEEDVVAIKEKHFSEWTSSELWERKMEIRQEMKDVFTRKEFSEDCSRLARELFYQLRQKEDYLDEVNFRKEGISAADHAFVDSSYLRVNPQLAGRDLHQELRSGDIILSRGKAYTSAAISHLGEFDTQFSHLSFVYQDERGKFWTIEAHIEIGSFVRELADHIEDKNARTVIFRFQDPQLAHQASAAIFKKVNEAFDTRGPINYDFGFDKKDSSELFCSEIISHGFELVDKSIEVPLFESAIFKRKPQFVKQLGLKALTSFIPADLEVDPRFEMIAEWKNPQLIGDLLQKDAIAQGLFKWSEEEGHVLQQASTGTSLLYRNIVWPMRRVPLLKRFFVDKLPLNMSREMIGYFGVLETIGKILHQELKEAEMTSLAKESRLLSPQEKQQVLEDFRKQESKRARKLRKSFHP